VFAVFRLLRHKTRNPRSAPYIPSMTTKDDKSQVPTAATKRHERELEGGAGGAIAGAAIGAVAGPPGAIVGAVIGAIAGALTGAAVSENTELRETEDEKLDRSIGVADGEIGATNLDHPPAKIGAFSGSSTGSSTAEGEESAEGPMQTPS
jgi:hypothetical protein